MKIEVFALCDAATGDNSGKLNLLGAFDTLFGANEPLVHASCAVALRMRFEPTDEGTHPIELRLLDGDGKTLIPPMKANVTVGPASEVRTVSRNFILNFQQLRLPKFGEYRIDLFYRGQPAGWIPLYALKARA